MLPTLDYYVPWPNMHAARTDSKRDALVGGLSVIRRYGHEAVAAAGTPRTDAKVNSRWLEPATRDRVGIALERVVRK
jgi:hypothetical protein